MHEDLNSTDLDTDTEPLERSLEQGVLLEEKGKQFGVDKRGELDLFLAELREELDHVRPTVLCVVPVGERFKGVRVSLTGDTRRDKRRWH